MCFSSGGNKAQTPEPAVAPAPPAIPSTQSTAAEPTSAIGFGRKRENKQRFGKADGPTTRRSEAGMNMGGGGSGIRM